MKLPDVSTLASTPGKKENEIKLFREGGEPMAYCWTGGAWTKIGTVTGRGAPSREAYPGDAYFPAGDYDHVVDV
jgi:hypothetical protein